MSDDTSGFEELIAWLKEQGHTPEEIKKIMDRVNHYEREMGTDSVMDSLAKGNFNLDTIIAEALNPSDE